MCRTVLSGGHGRPRRHRAGARRAGGGSRGAQGIGRRLWHDQHRAASANHGVVDTGPQLASVERDRRQPVHPPVQCLLRPPVAGGRSGVGPEHLPVQTGLRASRQVHRVEGEVPCQRRSGTTSSAGLTCCGLTRWNARCPGTGRSSCGCAASPESSDAHSPVCSRCWQRLQNLRKALIATRRQRQRDEAKDAESR
jgi:hypothetical protein